MEHLIDKGLLLLLSILPLLSSAPGNTAVLTFWTAILLTALHTFFADWRLQFFCAILQGALPFLLPEAACFLPLAVYALCGRLPQPSHSDSVSLPVFKQQQTVLFCRLLRIFGFLLCTFTLLMMSASRGLTFFCYLLSSCFAAGLLRSKTDTNQLLRSQYNQTRDDDTELQLLLKERNRTLLEKQDNEIYTATLRERNRISREIHDNVGHMLTRSILMVGALRTICHDAALSGPLQQLNDTLDEAMNSIRRSVHDLHDDSVNLEESLRTLLDDFQFCPITLHYTMSPVLPRELKYCLIAITKEGLVNIARHSHATAAALSVIEHPGFYQYILSDNGVGADSISAAPATRGIGLENMEARVRALHGTLSIQSQHGFRIHIAIPKAI